MHDVRRWLGPRARPPDELLPFLAKIRQWDKIIGVDRALVDLSGIYGLCPKPYHS